MCIFRVSCLVKGLEDYIKYVWFCCGSIFTLVGDNNIWLGEDGGLGVVYGRGWLGRVLGKS